MTGSLIIILTSAKEWGFLHIGVGSLTVAVVVFIKASRDLPGYHTTGRMFSAGYHMVAEVCTLGKGAAIPRNVANRLIRPTAIVWLVLNCSSLVILVVLYNVAREELNFNNTVFIDQGWFYGSVGLVLATAPVHYALLHYQVE